MGTFRVPPPKELIPLELGGQIPFWGLNLKNMDNSINDGQTPYSINVNLDDGGKPTKRRGQKYVFASGLGAGAINGLYKEKFFDYIIFAHGTKLYKYDEATDTRTELMTGLSNTKGYFYTSNDVLYYKNGVDWIHITSSFVATTAVSNAYIPTLTLTRGPTGGGSGYEQFNLAGAGFRDSFSGTVGATAYSMSLSGLDATAVTAVVNEVAKVETTDFTVDRSTGIVTFNVAPGAGTDNVVITAYKTVVANQQMIIKAVRATGYGGGTNDSRIFVCGNPDYKNVYWYTGLTGNTAYDALYYPENNFNRIGSDAKAISAWSYLYSSLIALKEDGLYKIVYNLSGSAVTFPVSILNRQVFCDMPDSVQIIKNSPVFGNTQSGLWTIISNSWIESEKNVEPISGLINLSPDRTMGLLSNTSADLQNATSFDDGEKYHICVNGEDWVWDYYKSPYQGNQDALIWFNYTNVNANNWAYIDRETYYGDATTGHIVKFQDLLNDFGSAINAVHRSKLFDGNKLDWMKTIKLFNFRTRANQDSSITIKFYNDNGDPISSVEAVPVNATKSFSLKRFSLNNFTVRVTKFAPTIPLKPNIPNVIQWQVEFSNNVLNETLSVLGWITYFTLDRRVK
jgi:hypothetical protein